MNTAPSGERFHIAFFGRRNAGKSSLVNAVTGQKLAVVSSRAGTTTDPVYKAMELPPAGPVMIIDTPGFDDEGVLGRLRVEKTYEILGKTDLAVLVIDAEKDAGKPEEELAEELRRRGIPHLTVYNKKDLLPERISSGKQLPEQAEEADASRGAEILYVSTLTGEGIEPLRNALTQAVLQQPQKVPLAADLLPEGGAAVLVIPIDESAPKGRLILPQQQVIRELIETGRSAHICRETELVQTMQQLKKPPAIVITDSQVFARVSSEVPEEIPLTSFSILMARRKGFLRTSLAGIGAIEDLKDGDRILIAEGCTHHRQCNDIGTVKIPRWLRAHTGAEIRFCSVSGREYPLDLSPYRAVIHCGGCMLNEREVRSRMERTSEQGIPFINYGILIAHMNGILQRSTRIPGLIQDLHDPALV